jgi:hypothetical protein
MVRESTMTRRIRRQPAALAACLLAAFLGPGALAPAGAQQRSLLATLAGCDTARAEPLVTRADPPRVGLGNRQITLTVQGLTNLVKQAGGCEKLVLFLGGLAIKGLPPESCNPATCRVRFLLDRNEENDAAWHALLHSPTGFTRETLVSVGPTNDEMVTTLVQKCQLEILPPLEFYLFLGILAATLVTFFYLTQRTGILRNPHVEPPPGRAAPYDLGRFQLAFWFFLVIAAYVFIWMVTAELDTITGSVLGLLAIGSGTALGSSLIDGGASHAGEPDAPANPAPAALAEAPVEPPKVVQATRGFLHDILHDARGLSLYRFQLFVWTIVLGVIFCVSVYDGLSMPQFNPTLLGLMGISSGTFLGAKFPER